MILLLDPFVHFLLHPSIKLFFAHCIRRKTGKGNMMPDIARALSLVAKNFKRIGIEIIQELPKVSQIISAGS